MTLATWRRGIRNEPATRQGEIVTGQVGADAEEFYAAAVEANHPSKAGFMRRAADREFTNLAGRIAKWIK